MKVSISVKSLSVRLVAVSAMLLFAQQSMAVGTRAGLTVSNQATVNYSVGTVPQSGITSAAADFVVDNRVDFTIAANPTPVVPTAADVGDFDVTVEFVVGNTGNQWQDYSFLPSNLAALTDVDGLIDSGDMNNLRVIADNNDDGILTVADADAFIDELEPDTTRLVWILADTDTAVPNELVDGDVANVELTATTNDGNGGVQGGAVGGVTVASVGPDNPLAEDVVLAVGGVSGEGSGASRSTYTLSSAALTITKANTLVTDPFVGQPGYTGPFHIPGATVNYSIAVANPSATIDAEDAVIIDNIPAEMLVADGTVIALTNGIIGGIAEVTCTADIGDSDGDGCGIDQVAAPQVLNIGSGPALFLTVPQAITMSASFDLTIR
jgi:hypothetical protein